MRQKIIPVSVMIPTYRGSATIGRAVAFVMAQTVLPQEIICIEDGSNDGDATWNALLAIKEKYGDSIVLIRHEKNRGSGPARNTGWDKAKGKYIALLDQDDIWHPQKLEVQYQFMKNNPNVDLLGCPIKWLRTEKLPEVRTPNFSKLSKLHVLFRNAYFTSSVIFKKDIPLRFPALAGVDDYHLWLNLAARNYSLYFCDAYLCFMLKPPFGVSGFGADVEFMHERNLDAFRMLKSEKIISSLEYAFVSAIDRLKMPIRRVRSKQYKYVSKKSPPPYTMNYH